MCNDVLLVLATLNKEVPPYSRNRTRFLQRIDTLLGHQRDGLRLNFGLAMQMHRRSYNSASIRPAAGGAGVGGGIGGGGGGGQGGRGRGMAVTSAGQQNSSQPIIALYIQSLAFFWFKSNTERFGASCRARPVALHHARRSSYSSQGY